MVARLGLVLYTTSWLIGGPLIALMVFGWAVEAMPLPIQLLVGSVAVTVLALGRAALFVLAGR